MAKHIITKFEGFNQYNYEADINVVNGSARIQYKGYNIVWNRTLISFTVTNAPYSAELYAQLAEELEYAVCVEESKELLRKRNENLLTGTTATERKFGL